MIGRNKRDKQGEPVLCRMSSKLCIKDYTFVTFDNFDNNYVKDYIDMDENDR